MNKTDKSKKLLKLAENIIPGGVNSPVRAFKAVGGTPRFIERGEGAYIYDVDGNRYLDFCSSWGPLILGHADPDVVNAVNSRIKQGLSYGASTELEYKLADFIVKNIEPIEKIRFVSSGTEAVMSAIRVARGFTGRDMILKFEGCYHGHSDYLLVSFFKTNGDKLAAVIIEGVPANNGLLIQRREYIHKLRRLTEQYGTLLIFDEVITGFRLGLKGAAAFYEITPDLVTYGKIIGGGMPVGAFGGRAEIMDKLSPLGPVYQAGTLSGNPIAMTAGLATLEKLADGKIYSKLEKLTGGFVNRLKDNLKGLDLQIPTVASIFWLVFQKETPRSADKIDQEGIGIFNRMHNRTLDKGIYLPPSGYEVCFISAAHDEKILTEAADILTDVIKEQVASEIK